VARLAQPALFVGAPVVDEVLRALALIVGQQRVGRSPFLFEAFVGRPAVLVALIVVEIGGIGHQTRSP
jgi:hypothetical protein